MNGTPNAIQIIFMDPGTQKLRGVSIAKQDPEESTSAALSYPNIEQDELSPTTYPYEDAKVLLDDSGTPSQFVVSDRESPAHISIFASCVALPND